MLDEAQMNAESYRLLLFAASSDRPNRRDGVFSAYCSLILRLPLGDLLCISYPAAGIKPRPLL